MLGRVRRPSRMAPAAVIACTSLLLVTIAAVRWSPAFRDLDARAFDALSGTTEDAGAVRVVAGIADPIPFLVLGAVLAGLACARGLPRLALAIVALLASATAATKVLKLVLSQGTLGAEAFPSGHTTAAFALAAGLTIVVPRRMRRATLIAAVSLAAAVGAATILLGWHTPSDVLGGVLVATAAAAAVVSALASAPRSASRRERRAPINGGAS